MLEKDISKASETNITSRENFGNLSNIENQNVEEFRQAQVFGNSSNPSWHILTAILVWLISVLSVIFTQALSTVFYAQYKNLRFTNPQEFSEIIQKDQTALVINLIAVIPAHILTLLFAWLVVTGFKQRPFFQTLSWQWKKIHLSQVFSIVLVFNALAFALFLLVPENKENDFQKIITSSETALYLTALIAITTAPLVEEIVYRGVLYSSFEQKLGKIQAVFIVSLLFGLVHVPQYYPSYVTIVLIFALSFFLAVVRAYTGNLFLCVIIHTLHNFIQAGSLVVQHHLKGVN
ncbi:MAG: CPBP family intramembrane metalloprotease [Acidobacteria bacterium]|nr:MAG: CPBP family intramembrane metalloprotease [Acidobacteriota bacterium]GIU81911.1 MAG: hypothetical protein KatS3mg006_0975 [Pyrinomonadaceae bacterium]